MLSPNFIATYTKQVEESLSKTVAALKTCPPLQRRVALLKIIESVEGILRKLKRKRVYLEKTADLKQRIMNMGSIEATASNFGEAELVILFDICKQADIAIFKKSRIVIFVAIIGLYLLICSSFFITIFSTSIFTTNPITFSAAIIINLLSTTCYVLSWSVFEKIFKPLNRFGIRYKSFQYDISSLMSAVFTAFLLSNYLSSRTTFVLPYVLPFFIKLIEGVLRLNFGSLLATALSAIIYVMGTLVSLIDLWKFISDFLEKRKRGKQLNTVTKIDKDIF